MNFIETARQLVIEGVQPPPPPIFSKVDLIKALVEHIEKNGLWSSVPAEKSAADIASQWSDGIDGYELAKNLDNYKNWSHTRKAWASAWNIQPPYPIGTHVTTRCGGGVIAGVSDYHAAAYLVKEDGCKQEGRHMVINFEDATPTSPAP